MKKRKLKFKLKCTLLLRTCWLKGRLSFTETAWKRIIEQPRAIKFKRGRLLRQLLPWHLESKDIGTLLSFLLIGPANHPLTERVAG